ncbi:MAG: hypothetical protein JWO19_992 [Bryobacterales bacterium]|nr:hypothetical protein [Bryobacterales bacterium]
MNLLLAAVLVALGLVLSVLVLQFRKLSDLSRKETDLAPVLNNLPSSDLLRIPFSSMDVSAVGPGVFPAEASISWQVPARVG